MEQQKPKRIVCIGGICLDTYYFIGNNLQIQKQYVFNLDRMPKIGESLHSNEVRRAFGGKGTNYALQCCKLGAQVTFLSQVGDDSIGKEIIKWMKDQGIDISCVHVINNMPTSQAIILLLPDGTNTIISECKASSAFDPKMKRLPEDWEQAIINCDLLILQNEVPFINALAAQLAKSHKKIVHLDVGGINQPLKDDLLQYLDIISPNNTEFDKMIDKEINQNDQEQKEQEIRNFLNLHINLQGVLLKLGEKGCEYYYLENQEMQKIIKPAYNLNDYNLLLVDTTGAGDCFQGAFAYGIVNGAKIENSMALANQAGCLCVTTFGSSPSVPSRERIEQVFGNIEKTLGL